jgi:hypothetical protein
MIYSLSPNYLLDPQQMNSYAYARNNSVIYNDPTGKCIEDLCIGEVTALSYLAVMYAPQIMSFAQSLSTPLGQMGIDYVRTNYQQGNYKTAIFGALTAGEFGGGLNKTGSIINDVKSSGVLNTASTLVAQNFSKGQAFENKVLQTVGEIKNTTKINNGLGDRIPDILNVAKGTIGEVKNTNNVYLTPQMKTFVTQAQKTNMTFTLYVNEVTKVSKPLIQAIDSIKGLIQRITK